MLKALVIFLITYVLISGKRSNILKIGRTGGVLLGAVLMVAAGVVGPAQAYKLVNWDTILLLLGMMIIIEHLADAEFFEMVARWISLKRLSTKGLLALIVFGFGFLAAFLVNDIVCIFFTPLLLVMIRERKLVPLPYLLALATSANLGSTIAFTGNPQNMIIGNLSLIPYARYFWMMLPIGLVGLLVNYLLLVRMYRKELAQPMEEPAYTERPEAKPLLKRSLGVMLLVIIGFFVGGNMAWVAVGGATLLLLLARRDEGTILIRLDWNLLLFFAGLFVVIGGLQVSGVTQWMLQQSQHFLVEAGPRSFWNFGILTVIGSNLFSNVPYVLVAGEWINNLAHPLLMWYMLAYASTVAGNLTIIGSVANVIVVEKSRDLYEIGFWDYFRFGLPSTLITFILGMLALWGYHLFGLL